ncbi:MAG: heterodisulfide reductase-related iron-sulfur binding cluster [Bryobacterales bacterium]|nr:heterodisulfide reductase-related iron-sulfur binding cluster [Bryobacteraceae bacterium]MDW8131552.1 heterodisulfide reductase-related iron-sulfur binding cluster [Bryobacterales bacterium]
MRIEGAAISPLRALLDRCVHCGLCLNACPTYRELGLEADSPRGRIYQMVRVAEGAPISDSYVRHLELCLACRACETACPSGVRYGRLIESARAEMERKRPRPWPARLARRAAMDVLLPSAFWLRAAGTLLWLYQATGMRTAAERSGLLDRLGSLGRLARLAPRAEPPFFYRHIGKVFPAEGERRARVALLAGCVANVCFARLNEATVRVLQKNGCEVVVPRRQTCCGALHAHTGRIEKARELARRNVDALLREDCDAIVTNAAGCGSTMKEYGELLEDDRDYAARARSFAARVRDVTELLATLGLRGGLQPLEMTVTYQDSCHLAHGQKIRAAPRQLLAAVPGLHFVELPGADSCCGSAGIYNALHAQMADSILRSKMEQINATGASVIATANPGCLLQLRYGVARWGRGQRVLHVIEILDESYAGRR